MAVDANVLRRPNSDVVRRPAADARRRPSDRGLFLWAAILFPLFVLVGYFKSYYFSAFFDVRPIANSLVHAHGVVMSVWVLYFSAQVALVRSKNVRLHRRMGMAGVGLAALVVVVGLATAYDAHLVRGAAPAGLNPHGFLLIPLFDMLLFVLFFGAAVYYRRRPAEHKSLMLLTAINFLPAAVGRIPLAPAEYMILWAFGVPAVLALACLGWHTAKHGRLNRVFAAGVLLLIASGPLRIIIAGSQTWLELAARLAP
ncbi:MAG TPA: hypothetical protein VEY09_12150 [Pyrinomonadaceae bacterium]|nr:hypothetical protein [Pyrinomonadaceae bacterium]